MRYLILIILAITLISCDSKTERDLKRLARSKPVQDLLKNGFTGSSPKTKSSPPTIDNIKLVRGSKGVGHRDFDNAKQVLPQIYKGIEEDVYCGCQYSGKNINFASCGYKPRKNAKRAARLEWEHVMPAEHFGSQLRCWDKGGRKNCSGKVAQFDMMEGDLNNLLPSVGEVNGDRSNMSYSAWTSSPKSVYGQCRSIPDFDNRRFQPREEVRGRLARITIYMHQRYGLDMSNQDKKLFCGWAKQYPVDSWEIERDKRIVRLQGEGNPFVENPGQIGKFCQ